MDLVRPPPPRKEAVTVSPLHRQGVGEVDKAASSSPMVTGLCPLPGLEGGSRPGRAPPGWCRPGPTGWAPSRRPRPEAGPYPTAWARASSGWGRSWAPRRGSPPREGPHRLGLEPTLGDVLRIGRRVGVALEGVELITLPWRRRGVPEVRPRHPGRTPAGCPPPCPPGGPQQAQDLLHGEQVPPVLPVGKVGVLRRVQAEVEQHPGSQAACSVASGVPVLRHRRPWPRGTTYPPPPPPRRWSGPGGAEGGAPVPASAGGAPPAGPCPGCPEGSRRGGPSPPISSHLRLGPLGEGIGQGEGGEGHRSHRLPRRGLDLAFQDGPWLVGVQVASATSWVREASSLTKSPTDRRRSPLGQAVSREK